jgi:hypothetical protein
MSYDLAVWEGARPATDIKALQLFHRLYDNFMDSGEFVQASPQIQSYVAKLLDRWPEIDAQSEVDKSCPWVHRPLIHHASGPLIYFAIRSSRAFDVVPYAAQLATDNGLVCFDPQAGELR